MQSSALAWSFILTSLALWTAAAVTPEYFIVKTSVVPGQTDKSAFDNLYVYSSPISLNLFLTSINGNAAVFNLEHASPATGNQPALSYWNLNFTDNAQPTANLRSRMGFNEEDHALWQPVSFIKIHENQPSNQTKVGGANQFYFKNTSGGDQLEWYNTGAINKDDTFEQWLVCDWQFGLPQLFFTVKTAHNDYHSFNVLSTCAEVDLVVIPVPPSQS